MGNSDEPLVDLRDMPEVRVDARLADPAGAYAQLREGVVSRLLDAHRLLPRGLSFLVTEAYRPLDRQQAIFDEYRDELRRRRPATNISPRARHHRRILSAALTRAGFANYPTQWWHWSFGDRYWAHHTGADRTRYGPTRFTPAAQTNGC
ncbi:M15 family metallopeptidase [Phytohabitans flavus]|uniref:M15 family metallopeptidase n=1 Tax=Phytohabitans flavus TaxID=1076124 RepID=UPI001E3F13C9|nr:M15 family metallopeptidase [Phytohabitans flavus]